jgi:hypothetical protein
MNFSTFYYRIIIAILLITAIVGDFGSVHSATRIGWGTPHYIPGLVDDGLDPYFLVDPAGGLHVFHSQWVENRVVISYSNWTVGVGWMAPVDVIVSEVGQARISGAFVDDTGMINVIFWGGNDQTAGIFFTRAPLSGVNRSTSWSKPRLIGSDAIAPTTVAITSNQEGYLVVIYACRKEGGNSLYSVVSHDYGATWTAPSVVFSTASNSLWPVRLDMITSRDGSVHAVWALVDTTGNGLRIYYTSLPDGLDHWNSSIVLTEAVNSGVVGAPSILEHNRDLIVIFHNDFPMTRYMTVSNDNGETWSTPVRLFEQVGSNGSAAMVVDGANTLHMFFGNRIGASLTHGVWHSIWERGGWGTPIPVVSGPQVLRGPYGEEGFDPSDVQAMICGENILFIAWRHDPRAGPTNIWYTYHYLDTPALPTLAVRTPTARVTIAPESGLETGFEDLLGEDINRNVEEAGSLSTAELLVYSLVPALLLIAVLLLWRQNRR